MFSGSVNEFILKGKTPCLFFFLNESVCFNLAVKDIRSGSPFVSVSTNSCQQGNIPDNSCS